MLNQQGYDLVDIGNHRSLTYSCVRASAYAASFKRCLRRPESGDEREQLRDLLNEQLRAAYDMRREDSLHALHASLNEILFRRFNRTRDHVERSPLMFEVQQRIIEAQLDADLQSFKEESLPQSADAFEHWYDARSRLDGRTPHRLFDFIQTQANEAQFRRFIEVEAGVHVSFDDVLALAQVGVRGAPKSEFFHNLQDEVGSTNPDKFHLTMFERLVEGLGIRSISRDALPWEALACGSYMMFLAHFRDFYLYCVGYLGCLEAITPARFGSIARGGARLGVDESLLDYYAEHSVLDTQHAQGWLHNIILPAIYENGAQTSRDIATGVRLRECVAERYWDAMLAELTAPRRSTRKGT